VKEYARFVREYNQKLRQTKAPEDDAKANAGEFAEQLAYYRALKPRMQARLEELNRRSKAKEAGRNAQALYAPEFRALHGGLRGYFSGHYNRDLPRYTSSLSGKTAASAEALAGTDNPGGIEKRLKIWSSGKAWRTKVDWDWRIRAEVDGRIKNLPLLRKWVLRIRGPVVTKRPVGSNPKQ
jgi:hypothetical protein